MDIFDVYDVLDDDDMAAIFYSAKNRIVLWNTAQN